MLRNGLFTAALLSLLAGCTQSHIGASGSGAAGFGSVPPAGAAEPFASSIGGGVTAADGSHNGGLLGDDIGGNLSDRDRAEALAAEYRALEFGRPGRAVVWRNDDTGHHGEVTAGSGYTVNDLDCRDFKHIVYIGGRPKTARGTACRRIDRTWRIVG